LVIHGLGLDKRGFVETEKFGTTTLAEYNNMIADWGYAVRWMHVSTPPRLHLRLQVVQNSVAVETWQSNDAKEVCEKLLRAQASGFSGIALNPGGFFRADDAKLVLQDAITRAGVPVIEVHYTNPLKTLGRTNVGVVCAGVVFGFGPQR
jgi:3-dehydroquinate dehydratase